MFDYLKRVCALREDIAKRRLDSFLVTNETNVRYLSGFLGHDSLILVTLKNNFFITDSRYIEEAQDTLKEFEIELVESSTYDIIARLVKKGRLKRVGFEAMNLPYEVAARLKTLAGHSKLVPVKDLLEGMRARKDSLEIKAIKRSIGLAKDILNRILRLAKPGMTEKFLSNRAEIEFIERGSRPAFYPVIAAGRNSSKPHATPTDDKLEEDSHLMVDIGCNLDGYNSDLTRMLFIGKVKETIKKIYNIVRDAQKMAIDKIMPGKKISEIDMAARSFISDKGFGKYFGHSLGHGVGLEVHECPTVSKINQDILKPSMVFTVEPAVYIPKLGGVRLEDMVLVTDNGCEVLT